MSKTKSNAIIEGLPANQREAAERWLFEENLSQAAVAERLRLDFSVRISESAVASWYQRRWRERKQFAALQLIRDNNETTRAVLDEAKKSPTEAYDALMFMVKNLAMDASVRGEKMNLKELSDLANLALINRGLELKEQEITLKRDRFQFDAAAAAMKCLPALRKIAADNTLAEPEKIKAAMQELFGELPK